MNLIKLLFRHLIILSLFLSCSKSDNNSGPSVPNPNTEKNILFIGNSHTHFNLGLNTHVKNFANSFNLFPEVKLSAPNGFTLEDHLNNQATLDLINSKHWDVIILQENTFIAANEPSLMLASIQEFKTLLLNSGATIYLFKTWAYEDSPEMLSNLTSVYNDASLITGYNVVSVGNYWKDFNENQNINLYSDNIHPNNIGTYLTSAIFYKKIFNPNNLEDSNYNSSLAIDDAEIIKSFVNNLTL